MHPAIIFTIIPLISALIGWFTNHLAVRMLFRPRRPVRILWFTFAGLIPRRQAELAAKIGETVEKELISHRDIHDVVTSSRFRDEILDTIISRIEEFIYVNLGSSPLVALALSGEAAARIRQLVRDELARTLPGVMEELFEKVESQIDFKEIVRAKIDAFDLARLEGIVYNIAARELRAIEWVGAVLGFLIGLGQVAFLMVWSV
ncbi:MAG: DUF445 family protein [Chitinivibrionales bacterium]|nr:DUF445 family protein [Chitinivibrionales bacterium]MBD3395846.1 DUF445 family protein [Chitinivibrionales bacterium]